MDIRPQPLVPVTTASGATHSDGDLVAQYTAGDSHAFSEIVRRHRDQLMWVARRYAKTEEDAHDILQEAWLRASRNLNGFRNESALSTWLNRLVRNSGYDFQHHKSRREQPVLDEDTVSRDVDIRLAHDPTSEIERALLLREALSHLTPDQSAALVLVDVVGFNVDQAAQTAGVAPGTIKSRRGRAKRQLRALLTDGA